MSPATGKKLTVKDVLRLKMAKNQDNQWHCPVTCKCLRTIRRSSALPPLERVSKDASRSSVSSGTVWRTCWTRRPSEGGRYITIGRQGPCSRGVGQLLAPARRTEEARRELGTKGSFKQTDAQKEVLAEAKRNVQEREAQRLAKEKARQEALNAPDRPENRASRRRIWVGNWERRRTK